MLTRRMMRKLSLFFLLLILTACQETPSATPCLLSGSEPFPPSQMLIKIGSSGYSEEELRHEIADLPDGWRKGMQTEATRQHFLDQLILRKLAYLQAIRTPNQVDEKTWADIRLYAERKLAQVYLQKRASAAVVEPSAQEIDEYYQSHSDEFFRNGKPMEKTEAEASVKARLMQKRDLDVLKQISSESREKFPVTLDADRVSKVLQSVLGPSARP